MEVSLQSLTSFFESWGEQIPPSLAHSFSRLDWDETDSMGANSKASAGTVALAAGAASLGGALAAAALGNFLVLHERGEAPLPWHSRSSKPYPALSPKEWSAFFDPATGRMRAGGLKAIGAVRLGGCANAVREEVWPFLLGLQDPNSTYEEREMETDRRLDEYLRLRMLARAITRRAFKAEERRSKLGSQAELREQVEQKRAALDEAAGGDAEEGCVGSEERREQQESEGRLEESETRESRSGAVEGLTGEAEFLEASSHLSYPGVLKVSEPPSLDVSTESFVEVPVTEGEVASSSEGQKGVQVLTQKSQGVQLGARSDGGAQRDEQGLGSCPDGPDKTWLGEGPRHKGRELEEEGHGEEGAQTEEDPDTEWAELCAIMPEAFKNGSGLEGSSDSVLSSFLDWRRIMRLDAVRANLHWLPFSSRSHFPEDEALEAVEEAELQNYEHLGTAARWHAARLVNILEAYAVKDPEIGYCQGMTDLLSPFVAIVEDDSEAFACFSKFMETARHNFRTDEVGIRKQLDQVSKILRVCDPELFEHLKALGAEDCIFAYRMIVVLLRRELSFEQTVHLWEVLWAEAAAAAAADATAAAAASVGATVHVGKSSYSLVPARSDFFLFVIGAIILSKRTEYLQCEAVDEVLRLCNSLGGEIDVWQVVRKARNLVALWNLLE